MTMKHYLQMCTFLVLALSFGCDQTSIADGALNGKCRLDEIQCNDGLLCREGLCVPPVGNDLPTLEIAFELLKRDIIADGEDQLDFQLLVNDATTGEPFNGELLLVSAPSGVGQFSPGIVDIENGFGGGTYQSCNRRTDFPCPEVMSINLAHPTAPLEMIFESEAFRQLSPDITSPSALQMGDCRAVVGSKIGIILPNATNEKLSSDNNNPFSAPTTSTFNINTDALSLAFPLPDQRIDQYQALSPSQLTVTITPEVMETDAEPETTTAVSTCLADGVWVGSQRLELWTEEAEDANATTHVMSNLAIDCFDERGGYSVIRVCAHGTL